ncbi:MAG TPA: 5-formyltetrahydrofolate cyclo-ligase [Burkholderiaceae bacterium]|nr:5-formyltetrahydrofolate cyclo-ligase [Burkholderiaceae bacterium]
MPAPQDELPERSRKTLRERLIAERERFANAGAPGAYTAASDALGRELLAVLRQIEPELLGAYWPMRSEFNAGPALQSDESMSKLPLALPFTRRTPRGMEYRRWDGQSPQGRDDYGIAASLQGEIVVPDTVLVPCVGYTAQGYRLGYGGGFFDRWLAQHPHVTTIGIAWSHARLDPDEFVAAAHDQPLTLIVTEAGVVG